MQTKLTWHPCGKSGFVAISGDTVLHVDKSLTQHQAWGWKATVGQTVSIGVEATPQAAKTAAEVECAVQ